MDLSPLLKMNCCSQKRGLMADQQPDENGSFCCGGRKMEKVRERGSRRIRDNSTHQGLYNREGQEEHNNLSESSSEKFTNHFKSSLSYSRNHNCTQSVLLAFLSLLLVTSFVTPEVNAIGDPVYIRKLNGYLQLLSSDTLRWFKGAAKEPLQLMRPNLEPAIICRVWHTSLRGVGLVSEDQNVCNISTQEGVQGSDKYQTLSTSASRLVWKLWQRPNPPPIGAVAISFKPAKFLATDLNSSVIGYLDPSKNLGSGVFPNESEPATSCLVLTEIEPERYELSDVQLKRNKGFIEEDIVLAYGRLKYEMPSSSSSGSTSSNPQLDKDEWSSGEDVVQLKPESNEIGGGVLMVGDLSKKGKVESILSYEINTLDSWGQGYLMAKGLHTSIKLDDGSTKTIEWGIPNTQSDKTETMTAVAELAPGTGLNVTLRGTRIDGEMSYWATLKTLFKDGSSSTRLLEGHRRIKDIQDIRLEHSKIYFLFNDSVVPDPTTTTTSTTTTTPVPMDLMEDSAAVGGGMASGSLEDDEDGDEPQMENALPVESRNEFLADQGHHHHHNQHGYMSRENSPSSANHSSLFVDNLLAHSLLIALGLASLLLGRCGMRLSLCAT